MSDAEFEKEYQKQLAMIEAQESEIKTMETNLGMRPNEQTNAGYNKKISQVFNDDSHQVNHAIPQRKQLKGEYKTSIGKPDSHYELGKSSMSSGIFGPPQVSNQPNTGKKIAFNPNTGTYNSDRPF